MKLDSNLFIERKSLGEDVFEYLKDSIINQSIKPGSILVESKIAKMLNISRTPLREALHKLEREEWIEKTPSGSFQVITLTAEDIKHTVGIRSVLEAYAVRLAGENNRAEDLLLLEKMLSTYEHCLKNKEYKRYHDIITEFHDHLFTMSRNPKLIKMINLLRVKISIFRQIVLKDEYYARMCWKDHINILAAIKSGNGDEVEKVVRDHVIRGGRALLQCYNDKKLREEKSA
jgi:DNA-binding GntR family transcriptional regulator